MENRNKQVVIRREKQQITDPLWITATTITSVYVAILNGMNALLSGACYMMFVKQLICP